MGKLLKFIAGLIVTLLVLAIIVAILLPRFIDADKVKQSISKIIYDESGYRVIANGPIHWRLYPNVSLQISDLQITGTKNTTSPTQLPLMIIKETNFSMKLMPLLNGEIQIEAISLNQPIINLIKNTSGHGNWEVSSPNPENKKNGGDKTLPATTAKKQANTNKQVPINKVNVDHIEINNATVLWKNQQTQQQWKLTNLKFTANQPAFAAAFPVTLNFDVQNKKSALGNSHLAFSSDVLLQPQTKNYVLSKLRLKIDDSTMTGNINVTKTAKTNVTFKLLIDNLNLDRYLNPDKAQTETNSLPTSSSNESLLAYTGNNTDEINTSAPAKGLPTEFLQTMNINGDVQIQTFVFNKITMTDLNASIHGGNGILKIAPLTAKAYQGDLNNQIILNAQQPAPVWTFISTGNNVQFGALLAAVTGKDRLEGTDAYSINLQGYGINAKQIIGSLNGQISFSLKDGKLKNFNLKKVIHVATAIFKQQSVTQTNEDSDTDFSTLSLTATVNNGVLRTEDFILKSPVLTMSAKGNADLANKTIDMDVLATVMGSDLVPQIQELQDAVGGGIPLRLTGTFDKYHIEPDKAVILAAIAKHFLKQQDANIQKGSDKLKEKAKQIEEKFRGVLGN